MRKTLIAVLSLVLAVMLAAPALAQPGGDPHYVVGPTFTLDDATVTASGSLAGLGHWDVDLTLTVSASVTVECENKGGNIAPGQTKHFTDETVVTGLEPKNGRVDFTISVTADPAGVDLSDACPNPNWTAHPGAVTVHSATLEVSHGGVPQEHLTATQDF